MACFADINVSQGSVATYTRSDGIFNTSLTTNLPRNLPVKKNNLNPLRFDRIMVMSLWHHFFGPSCITLFYIFFCEHPIFVFLFCLAAFIAKWTIYSVYWTNWDAGKEASLRQYVLYTPSLVGYSQANNFCKLIITMSCDSMHTVNY